MSKRVLVIVGGNYYNLDNIVSISDGIERYMSLSDGSKVYLTFVELRNLLKLFEREYIL